MNRHSNYTYITAEARAMIREANRKVNTRHHVQPKQTQGHGFAVMTALFMLFKGGRSL